MRSPAVVGRFAPTPSGLLHAGSLVAALASWLDARAADGRWLVRIEDLDTPRNAPGAAEAILRQLDACGLVADEPPAFQSARLDRHRTALDALLARGDAYPCGCTRKDIDEAGGIYPGTCRDGLHGRRPRSVRLRLDRPGDDAVTWVDRRLGAQRENVPATVGDFVLERADGIVAYQLAVVVDDAADGITDVVRGEDLADNTGRQIVLQHRLRVATPRYLHVPLVTGADGAKLSKQNGAAPVDTSTRTAALAALRAAGAVLGVDAGAGTRGEWMAQATSRWRDRWATARTIAAPDR